MDDPTIAVLRPVARQEWYEQILQEEEADEEDDPFLDI